jgi:ubiquinone/menaquinone biosynthesis C-methylase UbiE
MLLSGLWKKGNRTKGNVSVPEDYWINLGEEVVGNLSIEDMLECRQIDTYRAIGNAVMALSLHQVVDLGCNVGITGVILRESGYLGEYVGIDANPNALRIAARNLSRYPGISTLMEGNLRNLNFPGLTFQCVIIKDVLEHHEHFKTILREALRVSDRYALVANFITWSEGETIIRREPEGYYHNLYSRKEAYSFIRGQGFEIINVISALEKDARPNEIVQLKRIRL